MGSVEATLQGTRVSPSWEKKKMWAEQTSITSVMRKIFADLPLFAERKREIPPQILRNANPSIKVTSSEVWTTKMLEKMQTTVKEEGLKENK